MSNAYDFSSISTAQAGLDHMNQLVSRHLESQETLDVRNSTSGVTLSFGSRFSQSELEELKAVGAGIVHRLSEPERSRFYDLLADKRQFPKATVQNDLDHRRLNAFGEVFKIHAQRAGVSVRPSR